MCIDMYIDMYIVMCLEISIVALLYGVGIVVQGKVCGATQPHTISTDELP